MAPSKSTTPYLTPVGIASFLNLEKPRSVVDGGEPRFSINLIFDKAAQNSKEFKAFEAGIDEAIKRQWPTRVPPNLRSPFRDGAEKAGQYDGYRPGDIFIQPWTKQKPGVVDIMRQDVLDFSEYFAGWTARAMIRPFAYEQGANKGVAFLLDSVQFLRPGKRLDGRKAASESFPDDMSDEMI
jgi:hypothetical protein